MLPLFLTTKQVLARPFYLEGFIRICAWCRKIGDGDKWMPLGNCFSKGFAIKTSHGICPECQKQLFQKTPRVVQPPVGPVIAQ